MAQTMTQTAMYRSAPEAGASSSQFGGTMSDSAAFGAASATAASAVAVQPAVPLARLDMAGARAERIVSGQNRYKYFRRPIIPFMNAQPPEVLFAPVEADSAPLELPQPEPEPLTKTVEVQSDFRESEAQTDPYTPAYVVPPDAPEPEVLTLTALTYGAGLPAGLNEVKMIERARQKREFEASLPPMTDEVSLALRRKMMGEQELRDWNVREEQILELQQEKLGVFDAGLRTRAEARENHWDERIEHMRQIKLTEKDKEISQIQRRRIKALRKLSEARKHVEASNEPRDVVAEYAEYGSEVYAPLTRNGFITRDKMAHLYETRPAQLQSLDGLLELEQSLPRKLLEPMQVQKPQKARPKDYAERKQHKMFLQLEQTDAALKAAKQARPNEKEAKDALLAAYRDTKPVERPPTPQVMPPEHAEQVEEACLLLQRLLRGRAVQNLMYEGKERRLELIRELRLDAEAPPADEEDALDEQEAEAEAGLSCVVDAVQAELVGNSLDRMSKELRRYTEERRIAEIVRHAEYERRTREAMETGRRVKELQARAQAEAAHAQLMGVYRASANSYIDSIFQAVVEEEAKTTASAESSVKEARVNTLVDKLEERHSTTSAVAGELVHGFLLPEVQRQTQRRTDELEESKFGNASRRALASVVDAVEARMAEE
jgi:hypothetical protein